MDWIIRAMHSQEVDDFAEITQKVKTHLPITLMRNRDQ